MLMANFLLKKLFTLNICHRAAPPAAHFFINKTRIMITTTSYENELLYLNSLVNLLQEENQRLRLASNTDWLTCVKFYVMSDRLIRDLIQEYKLYPSEIKLNSLKDRLIQFDSEIYHSDTAINKLRLNIIDTIKQAITECENYQKQ